MFRFWQRLKFFAGFFILGTLFVVVWYGMLRYSERYIKEAPEAYKEEETVVVPPELRPGYRNEVEGAAEESRYRGSANSTISGSDSLNLAEKTDEEKADTDVSGGNPSADDVPNDSKDAQNKEDVIAPVDKGAEPGSDARGEGAVIFGKRGSGEDAGNAGGADDSKEAKKPGEPSSPDTESGKEPASDPEPEPGNLVAMMQWLKVEKGDPVFLRIIKADRLMELWMKPREKESYVVVKKYPIRAMSGKLGPKKKKGDMQAPEGFYRTFAAALNPNSNYHLSFNVGYPNAWDRMNKRTGSLIMVHGSNVSAGCFAMGDESVEEIYDLVEAFVKSKPGAEGVPIQIYPFVPTSRRLVAMQKSEHYPFWRFLKDAWDWTELHKAPAPVRVGTNAMILEGNMLTVEGITERQVYRQAKLPERWDP